MGFHDDAIFPAQIAVDSTFGWGFDTSILTSNTGAEQRVARREVARHIGDVSTGLQDPEQLLELKAFHLARRGALYGFRFKDPLDHLSNAKDPCDDNTEVLPGDQQIGSGDGSKTVFQLYKTYSDTSTAPDYIRKITKPIGDAVSTTVRVEVDGVEQTYNTQFTVDHSTGLVTLSSAPALGEEVRAGFEFHTPVRFEKDADEAIEVAFQEFKYGEIPKIGIIEILDDDFAPDMTWNGGAYEYTGSSSLTISTSQGRYNRINMQASNQDVLLPDPATLPEGGPFFLIHNVGSNAFDIDTITGTSLVVGAVSQSLYQAFAYYNAGAGSNVWVLVSS